MVNSHLKQVCIIEIFACLGKKKSFFFGDVKKNARILQHWVVAALFNDFQDNPTYNMTEVCRTQDVMYPFRVRQFTVCTLKYFTVKGHVIYQKNVTRHTLWSVCQLEDRAV